MHSALHESVRGQRRADPCGRYAFLTGCCWCAWLILGAFGCTTDTASRPRSQPSEETPSSEAHSVLRAVLAEYRPESDETEYAVVASHTLAVSFLRGAIADLPRYYGIPNDNAFQTESGIAAIVPANQSERVLSRDLYPSYLRFASEADLDCIFRHCDHAWRRFYARFPGSRCILRVSWPGISPSGRRAAVYVTWNAQELVGNGAILLLEKKDGEWQVVERIGTYSS